MPDLLHTLLKYDIGHLRIIAELWGLELESQDVDSAAEELTASLLEPELVRETMDILTADIHAALASLLESGGKMEWVVFARKFGEIREMGAGKRDKDKPYLKPTSSVESLFYRGLLDRAFFDTEKGAQEFAYIPDDLFKIIKHEGVALTGEAISKGHKGNEGRAQEPLGRLATPVEKAFEILASDHVLDEATTLLAAFRIGRLNFQFDPYLEKLLTAVKLILSFPRGRGDGGEGKINAEAVKKFLEVPRAEALSILYKAWLESKTFDELRLIPGIVCEGKWANQPQVTREFLMNLIQDIPQNKWWSLPAFLRDIKNKFPDFQRPAGDYDSWFIKRESDGQYLRGFAYWDSVDGALVKYVIQMLHLLGQVDLASPEEGKEVTAFRIRSKVESQKSNDLRPSTFDGKLKVASTGKITISRMFSRAVRYQLARFCEWDEKKGDDYLYHVSAQSLKHANEQGLKAEQLLAMLVKYTNGNVPPALVKALKRWEANGAEARVENLLVLRVSKPEIMEEMRKSKAGKYLGEVLSPTAVVVKSGAIQKIMAELAELGLLAEVKE